MAKGRSMREIEEILLDTIAQNPLPFEEMAGDELEYFYYHVSRYSTLLSVIDSKIEDKKQKLLLDRGNLPGHLSILLKEIFEFEVTGVNHNLGEHFRARMSQNNIHVYKCNVEKDKLPFTDNIFDIVTCSELIEHLPFDPYHMLREVQRVLNKGGILILTTPNLATLTNRVKLLFGKSINWPLAGPLPFFERDVYDRHNREYTASEVEYMLRQCNFVRIQRSFFNAAPKSGKGQIQIRRFMLNLFSNVNPHFRKYLLIVAEKG